MKLIVGLGNPGREYAQTRHNAGFWVLDRLAKGLGVAFGTRKFKGLCAQGELPASARGPAAGDGKLWLVKPQTYMNLSGETVIGFLGYLKLERSALLVVVDDVALPVGALRLRRDGSAGGHNGLRDIARVLGGNDYARLRLGVGGREAGGAQAPADLAGHVLGRVARTEQERLAQAAERAAEACLVWVGFGVELAMNRFNSPEPAPAGNGNPEA